MGENTKSERREPATETTGHARRLGLVLVMGVATFVAGGLMHADAKAPPVGAGVTGAPWHAAIGDAVRFHARLDRAAVLQHEGDRVGLELTVAAPPGDAAVRVPTDLVVVLDRSGSMAGRKMLHARMAVQALAELLDAGDRMALVSYAGDARVDLPLESPAHAARARWNEIVGGLAPGGGTNLSAGLDRALALAERAAAPGRARRVVVVSDGLANQGDTSPAGLRARALRAVSGEFAITTVGVGVDFDGELLARLADAGVGNFHYLETAANLAEVFAAEFATARETVVSALTVELRPAPGVELVDAAGYPLERDGSGVVRFRPGGLYAGQERRLWLTLSVPAGDAEEQPLGELALVYRRNGERVRLALPDGPRVARVAAADDYYAAIDEASLATSVTENLLPRLQRRTANLLTAGRPEEAVAELRVEREALRDLNASLASPAVAGRIDALEALEKKLEGHARGEAPIEDAEVQRLRALGYANGRPGSRK